MKKGGGIIWDCGSPLYDSYEVATVGHIIERHALALVSPGGSMRFPATLSPVSGDRSGENMGVQVFKFLGMKLWKRKGKKSRRPKGRGFYWFCINVVFSKK